ncbi:SDR family NAD(P)-dependent oxidoreductase [Novosphingobium mangrovi (ex Huang et al. 2023)]|uniref:SDR family NAD(P)-dependent oxidoreductase n=1 Tax=Novosphingobium mangrovi (ex Huang et al. 2023) TaxID=2976432 RepID=A0ABT2I2W8_9SPHN|nr:SDR family NAD(P)-dependent oxidoreductase [Novosphingobium mangrovi (ex Huang et al. 2023)]MCT2399152.1 SDR family NAD(P)-dependent oxidoreductase [Novosphingobium mangrovi (ex Huang et al. 2023)]
MTDLRFDDRVAVITGGGRGLGRAHALLLASRGCKIVVNDPGVSMAGDATGEGPAEGLAVEIRAMGGEAVANTDSVATPEGGKAIIQSALDAFGRIDILIHSAGNVRRGKLTELAYEDFTAVLDVHLKGAYHVVREAFPLMMAQDFGRIVLTSSINGLYGKSDNVTYSMCKAGFMGLSNTAAIEGQNNNVKSNLIVPAAVTRMSDGIDTSQFPPMTPEQVAPMVGYLCHESCAATGEMYVAMGGRLARAWVAENAGVYQPDWTLEDVAAQIDAIRTGGEELAFPPVPDGQLEHLLHGFGMIRKAQEA